LFFLPGVSDLLDDEAAADHLAHAVQARGGRGARGVGDRPAGAAVADLGGAVRLPGLSSTVSPTSRFTSGLALAPRAAGRRRRTACQAATAPPPTTAATTSCAGSPVPAWAASAPAASPIASISR